MTNRYFKLLTITLLGQIFLFLPYSLPAQEGEYPDVNEFIVVDTEPEPLNMQDVRDSIGYPLSAIKRNIEGTVVLRVLVNEEGDYVKHKVLIPVDTALVAAVEAHVADLNFSPAFTKGEAVAFWMNIPFAFRLVEDEKQNTLVLISVLDSLIALEPENYEFYVKRALQHRNMGDYDKARADFTASIDHNPRINKRKKNSYPYLYYAYFGRGTVESLQGNFEDARRDLSLAKTTLEEIKNPDSALTATLPSLFLERAYSSVSLGDLPNAIKDYEWVIENAPELRCATWPMIMDAALTEEDYQLVLRAIDGQIICNPETPTLHYTRAYYQILEGNPTAALANLDTAESRNRAPNMRTAILNLRALAQIEMGQYESAQETVDQAMLINVLNPYAHYYQGLIQEHADEISAACQSWKKAVSYGLEGNELKAAKEKMGRLCPVEEE